MSDWFATKSAAPAANGGLDLVMPGAASPWGDALVAAVESGEVASRGHRRPRAPPAAAGGPRRRAGETRAWPAADRPSPDSPTRREQLTRLAAAGMTVLRNRGDDAAAAAASATVALDRAARPRDDAHGWRLRTGPRAVRGQHRRRADPPARRRVTVTDGVHVRTRPRAARPGFVLDPVTGAPGVRMRATPTRRDPPRRDGAGRDRRPLRHGRRVRAAGPGRAPGRRAGGRDARGRARHGRVVGAGGRARVRRSRCPPPPTTSAKPCSARRGGSTDVLLDAPTELVAEVVPSLAGRRRRARPGRRADAAHRRRGDRRSRRRGRARPTSRSSS